ncbi:MAG: histidine kinase [Anaerolineae bacterium CG2_30_64_16]|nr:MAG: histidine kinase [Anaerolineae bacterium CG2_30_64_16]
MQPLLRLINLSRNFSNLAALVEVNLDIIPGEVIGLAGRSGSGKSVLISILAGLYPPSSGDVYFAGQRLSRFQPHAMRRLGIEVIHQKADLADDLDITSNIFLGSELGRPARWQWLSMPDQKHMADQATHILERLGVSFLSPREKARNLSGEQRQIVAIARTMARPARLIVVDESLVTLSLAVNRRLLDLIQEWRDIGRAVVVASSSLDDLFGVTDRLAVFRDGRIVAQRATDAVTQEEVVALLAGSPEQEPVTPIIWALDSYYRARAQVELLRHQQALLENSLAAQDSRNQELLAELANQLQALDVANVALQVAQRRLLTEREEERKHLARELHDQIIQDLLSTNYSLEEIDDALDQMETTVVVAEARSSIRSLIGELRRICSDLRPPAIDNLGLGAAIQSYAQDWAERTGISLTLQIPPKLGRLPENIELLVFRIVQEGLSNVRKHSRATAVSLCLEQTTARSLHVSICDNGQGLPVAPDLAALAKAGHFGLLGISERVALTGGRFELRNQPGAGLCLEIDIPHPRATTPT